MNDRDRDPGTDQYLYPSGEDDTPSVGDALTLLAMAGFSLAHIWFTVTYWTDPTVGTVIRWFSLLVTLFVIGCTVHLWYLYGSPVGVLAAYVREPRE